jgi:anti-anti-sigma factor
VERVLEPGQTVHRFTWHDRKAWWQQEQAILAYLILAGSLGDHEDDDWLRYARESAAFYNAWFLDHDDGSVYFNVLANGLPYLMGTERLKGSHSMAGYHSFELAFLATVYTNLLVTKEPMDLWYSPLPNALGDDVLRVAPDILPLGSVCIREVEIDGVQHEDFDSEEMIVRVPASTTRQKIRVRLQPIKDPFETETRFEGTIAIMTLSGKLDANTWSEFQTELEGTLAKHPTRLVLELEHLESMATVGLRVLLFARGKMDISDRADIYAIAPQPQVREVLLRADPDQEDMRIVDSWEELRRTEDLS